MRKTFHFEFVLRQSSPLRNFWVCRSSLKPDNFPEPSLQGLHGRRRSFGLRLRAFTSLCHGFCLGLLRAVFWQLRWYSFLHGWFANFTPDCAHFGWDVDFTSRRIVPTSLGHGFQQTSCSTATSVTSVFFATSSLRWRPRQHFSDFTARLCQHPRLRRKRR